MSDPAMNFVLLAIQDWGQAEVTRVSAVQAVLDAAGFNATATCSPVFGGIWPSPCQGADAEAATAWLQSLTDTMKRGRFQNEVAHVQQAIDARLEEVTAP